MLCIQWICVYLIFHYLREVQLTFLRWVMSLGILFSIILPARWIVSQHWWNFTNHFSGCFVWCQGKGKVSPRTRLPRDGSPIDATSLIHQPATTSFGEVSAQQRMGVAKRGPWPQRGSECITWQKEQQWTLQESRSAKTTSPTLLYHQRSDIGKTKPRKNQLILPV